MKKTRDLRTPLGKAVGLGSAKEGVEHWWATKLTSLALIPLGLWLIYSLIHLAGLGPSALQGWVHAPANAVLLSLFILTGLHHSAAGVQVVVEDYIDCACLKTSALIASTLLHLAVAGFGVFAILHMALGVG